MGSGAEGVRLRLLRMTEFLRAVEQAEGVWWWEPRAACQAVTQPELRRVGSARLQHPHQEAWSKVQTKNKGPVRSNFVSRRSPCKKKRNKCAAAVVFRGSIALFRCAVQQGTAVLLPPVCTAQGSELRGWLLAGHPEKSQKGNSAR